MCTAFNIYENYTSKSTTTYTCILISIKKIFEHRFQKIHNLKSNKIKKSILPFKKLFFTLLLNSEEKKNHDIINDNSYFILYFKTVYAVGKMIKKNQ